MSGDARAREAAAVVDQALKMGTDIAKLTGSPIANDIAFQAGMKVGAAALKWLIEQIGYDKVVAQLKANGTFVVAGDVGDFDATVNEDGTVFTPKEPG